MRLDGFCAVTDHDLYTDVSEDDHHSAPSGSRFAINGQPIAGSSVYNLDVDIGKTGCKVLRAVLRGNLTVDIQGHAGVFVIGTDVTTESSAIGIRPYPSGTQSYMGGYSRLHGDSYLSHEGTFGTGIRLNDVYISGSDVRFVFQNTTPTTQSLVAFGSVVCK